MTYKVKKEQAMWATVCLLLSAVPELLNALPEEAGDTDSGLPAMKPLHTFCAMRMEDGPCKAMIRSYFFNMYSHRCEEFIYGGCGGNENRFDTLEECQQTCIPGYKKTTVKTASGAEKPDFCFLEEDPGICRGFMTRYFYNNQSQKCERFKYGGCLGNLNNFETLNDCKNTCEDPEYNGPSWCLEPADRGLCKASEKRFYYNSAIRKCRKFNYSGCGGNNNNFITKKDCERVCKQDTVKTESKGGSKTERRKEPFVKVVYEDIN